MANPSTDLFGPTTNMLDIQRKYDLARTTAPLPIEAIQDTPTKRNYMTLTRPYDDGVPSIFQDTVSQVPEQGHTRPGLRPSVIQGDQRDNLHNNDVNKSSQPLQRRHSENSTYFENMYAEIPSEMYSPVADYDPTDAPRITASRRPTAPEHRVPKTDSFTSGGSISTIRSPDSGFGVSSPIFRAAKHPFIEGYDTMTKVQLKHQRRNQIITHVIIMALAGLVYIGLGILIGYLIGNTGCDDCTVAESLEHLSSTSLPTLVTSTRYNSTEDNTTNATTASPSLDEDIITTVASEPPLCQTEDGLCKCGPFGGALGNYKSDKSQGMAGNITAFRVRHNEYIVSLISFTYGAGGKGMIIGDPDGGTYDNNVPLASKEYITNVDFDFTSITPLLAYMRVTTNMRTIDPYGAPSSVQYRTGGGRLLYIEAWADWMIHSLTLYYDKCDE